MSTRRAGGGSVGGGSGGGPPTGAAGGDLGGTYPNPTVKSVANVTTGTLPIANGGTGAATAAAAITALTGTQSAGKVLRSDGTNATLSAIQAGDVPTLNQNTTGTASNVTGTVAVANGGTGQTSAQAAFDALAPATPVQGDLVYYNGTHWVRLAAGTSDQLLSTKGNAANPIWTATPKSLTTATFASENNAGNSGAAKTIDWTVAQKQLVTLTANCTFTFTAPVGVGNFLLRVVQDATGSRTATWPATVKWAGAAAPTLSTAANAVDIITFYYNGTNYYGVASLNFA